MGIKLFKIIDHEISRVKFESWIQSDTEFEIIGNAKSTKDIHKQLKKIVPDVIIIDSESMNLDKSLNLLKKMEKYNIKNIIVFSNHSDQIFILNKIRSEVKAYTSESECRSIFQKALKNI